MSSPLEPEPGTPSPAPPHPIAAGPLDRAGEAVVGWSRHAEDAARRAWLRARGQPSHLWAVAATMTVLVLFLVLVALLA